MKLALLDLDKTLLDVNYNLTIPEDGFCKLVGFLAKKGVIIGLCSDSSILSLQQWANRLGLTGPLVGERGAAIWSPSLGRVKIVDTASTAWLQDLRGKFIEKVTFRFPDATVVVGDATSFIRDRIVFPSISRQVLVVNSFRLASFSFFARGLNHYLYKLEQDALLLNRAARLAEEIISSFHKNKNELFWDENKEAGILIVHSANTNKQNGVKFLLGNLFEEYENIVMVGDSIPDYLDLSGVLQFAVGNATQQYKDKCSFVSNYAFTEGVVDSLKNFLFLKT